MNTINKNLFLGIAPLFLGATLSTQAADYGDGGTNWTSLSNPSAPSLDNTNFWVPNNNFTSSAIQAEVDEANADNGGRVRLRTGTYNSSGNITVHDNIRILGTGKYSSIIKRNYNPGSNASLLRSLNSSLDDMQIEDLQMDGNSGTNNLAQLNGFYVSSSSMNDLNKRIRVQDCSAKRLENGLLFGRMRHLRVQGTSVDQCGRTSLHHNIYLGRMGNILIYDCDISRSQNGNGIKAWGATFEKSWESQNFEIDRITCSDHARTGINPNGFGYLKVENNECDRSEGGSNSAGIFLGWGENGYGFIGTFRTDVINNKCEDNDAWGIYTEEGNRVWIEGNYCDDNNYNGGSEDNYGQDGSVRYESDDNTTL